MQREVTRVVTPGTLTDDALLDPRESNYLAAVAFRRPGQGGGGSGRLAWAELSTGRFCAAVLPGRTVGAINWRGSRRRNAWSARTCAASCRTRVAERWCSRKRPAWAFAYDAAMPLLTKHFGTAAWKASGLPTTTALAIRAAGAVLDYLRETQKSSLDHIDRLMPYRQGEHAGDRRSHAPQPGTHADDPRRAAAKARCWPCSTAPSRRWARGCWPTGWPIR